MRITFLFFIFSLLFTPLTALSASYDCQKAQTENEKLICSDQDLSKLDETLNTTYKNALSSISNKSLLVGWQRKWLSFDVKYCKDANCLKNAFSSRISMLKLIAPSSSPSSIWNGAYTRDKKGVIGRHSASIKLIGLNNNAVYIIGEAYWLGPNWKIGQIHDGVIDGIGKLNNEKLLFDIDECKGQISLSKKSLIVKNESGCGGMNVSFNGDYKKSP